MKLIPIILAALIFSVCERPPAPKEPDHSMHDHANANNHAAMDHAKMESSPGAAAAQQELQFLDTMIVHHQGAIDMAQLVNTRSQRPEMKTLAQTIIAEQRNEISQMQAWRNKWFGEAKAAINMDFPGMRTGMTGMDMAKLDSLKSNEFDLEFLRQMIPHHEGSIEMAKALKSNDSYAELKDLSDSIVTAQTAEIQQMKSWLGIWSSK